jgi:hypothetical protein
MPAGAGLIPLWPAFPAQDSARRYSLSPSLSFFETRTYSFETFS